MKQYKLTEIFYSLQGEGVRAGTAAVFVRFAGCNLHCSVEEAGYDCDTDHSCKMELDADEIWETCDRAWGGREGQRWVIFTGGEPALQLDLRLLGAFRHCRLPWHYAIETNGTIPLPRGLDWVTVSPKPQAVTVLSHCDEVKCVVKAGGPLPIPLIRAKHYLLSPAFKGLEPDPAAIARCVELVKENPRWRLSIQLHKMIGVR